MSGIRHGMLRADVYNEIKNSILNQVFMPGEALTESRLCSTLGVSRTPVREAFAQLESDGLVESVPNKGVVVRGIALQDIEDIYDIRQCIEGTAVRKACLNLDKEGIKRIEDMLKREEIQVKDGDYEGFQSSDYEFHDEIIKSSGSRVFQNVVMLMMQNTRVARVRSLSSGRRIANSLEEHYEIYDALREADPDKCYEKMIRHISNAKESFINTMIEKGIAYE